MSEELDFNHQLPVNSQEPYVYSVPDLSASDEPDDDGKATKKQKTVSNKRKPTTRVKYESLLGNSRYDTFLMVSITDLRAREMWRQSSWYFFVLSGQNSTPMFPLVLG